MVNDLKPLPSNFVVVRQKKTNEYSSGAYKGDSLCAMSGVIIQSNIQSGMCNIQHQFTLLLPSKTFQRDDMFLTTN